MNINQQTEHFLKFFKKQEEVFLKKGNDYSSEDRLSNFKTVAGITNLPVTQVALVMIGIKVARLGVLLKSQKQPENESISDSILDLANYSILLDAIVNEKKIIEDLSKEKAPDENAGRVVMGLDDNGFITGIRPGMGVFKEKKDLDSLVGVKPDVEMFKGKTTMYFEAAEDPRIKIKLEFNDKVVSDSISKDRVDEFIKKSFEELEKESPHLSVGVHTDNMKVFDGTSSFSATENSSKKEVKKEVLDGINKRWYDLVFLPIAPFFHFTGLRPARPFIAGEGLLTEEKREQFIKIFGKKAKGEKLDFNSDFELCPSYLRGSPVQFFINARTQEIDWEKTKEFYELWKKSSFPLKEKEEK